MVNCCQQDKRDLKRHIFFSIYSQLWTQCTRLKDDPYLGALWMITVNHFGYTCICLLQISMYFQDKVVVSPRIQVKRIYAYNL